MSIRLTGRSIRRLVRWIIRHVAQEFAKRVVLAIAYDTILRQVGRPYANDADGSITNHSTCPTNPRNTLMPLMRLHAWTGGDVIATTSLIVIYQLARRVPETIRAATSDTRQLCTTVPVCRIRKDVFTKKTKRSDGYATN